MQYLKKHIKIVVFVFIVLLAFALNSFFGWSSYLAKPGNWQILKQNLQNNTGKSLALYVVITVFSCVFLALPGVVFAAVAGILFGPVLGTVACCIAATIGACLAFLFGRYFLQDAAMPIIAKNKHLKKLFLEEDKQGYIFMLMLTRLVPIFPYNLQNFAYGASKISFKTYAFYSFIFMLPGTAAYTVAAAGFANKTNRNLYFLVSGLLLALVVGVSTHLKKRV